MCLAELHSAPTEQNFLRGGSILQISGSRQKFIRLEKPQSPALSLDAKAIKTPEKHKFPPATYQGQACVRQSIHRRQLPDLLTPLTGLFSFPLMLLSRSASKVLALRL